MIPSPTRALAFLAASSLTVLAIGEHAREDREPPLELVLEVAGQHIDVELDKAFHATIGDREVPMKLVAKPTRHFRFGGVEFDYPRHLAFDADHTTVGLSMWTLDGSDCVLMVQKYAGTELRTLLPEVIDTMIQGYGESKVKKSTAMLELAGEKLEGTRLTVSIAGQHIQQDLFGVMTDDASIVLIIQDSLDDGATTDETRKVVELLKKTLRISR